MRVVYRLFLDPFGGGFGTATLAVTTGFFEEGIAMTMGFLEDLVTTTGFDLEGVLDIEGNV